MNDLLGALNGMVSGPRPPRDVSSRVANTLLESSGATFSELIDREISRAQPKTVHPPVRQPLPRAIKPSETMEEETPEELAVLTAATASTATDAPEATASPDMEVNVATPTAAPVQTGGELMIFWSQLIKNDEGGTLIDILNSLGIVLPDDAETMSAQDLLAALVPQLEEAVAQSAAPSDNPLRDQLLAILDPESGLPLIPADPEGADDLKQLLNIRHALLSLAREVPGTPEDAPVTPAAATDEPALPPVVTLDAGDAAPDTAEGDAPDATLPARTTRTDAPDARGLFGFQPAQAPVTAPAVTVTNAQALPVSPSEIFSQIVQSASLNQQVSGVSQMQIQLNPAFLGRVNIILTATADGVTAQIRAQNDAVRGILAGGLTQLQDALKDMGLNMKSVDVTGSELGWDFSRGSPGGFDGRRESQPDNTPGLSPRMITLGAFRHAQTAERIYDAQTIAAPDMGIAGGVDYKA